MTGTKIDRRKFNGRKPGTMSAAERAQKSVDAFDSWVNPAIRAKRCTSLRRVAAAKRRSRQ